VGPWPSNLVVANDHAICTQCKGVVMVRLESPLRIENGLVEPSLEVHAPEELYTAIIPAQNSHEVSVRVLNAVMTKS
jgi:hypothetical protein